MIQGQNWDKNRPFIKNENLPETGLYDHCECILLSQPYFLTECMRQSVVAHLVRLENFLLRSLCNCEISPLRWPLVFDKGQILTFYVPDHLKKRPNIKLKGQIWNLKAKHKTPLAFGLRQRPNFDLLGHRSPKKEAKYGIEKPNIQAKCANQKPNLELNSLTQEGARHCRKPLGRRKGFDIFITLGLTKIKAFLYNSC